MALKEVLLHRSVDPLTEYSSVYLDLARFLLSQLVLIGHAASFFGVMTFMEPPHVPWVQSIAVVGFFWLLGFLICYSVVRKLTRPGYSFSVFCVERFARIYAAFVPALPVSTDCFRCLRRQNMDSPNPTPSRSQLAIC